MSNLSLTTYVKSTTALQQLLATLAKRRERGADALEYIGMIVLAAIIVGGLFAAAEALGIVDVFTSNADKILNK